MDHQRLITEIGKSQRLRIVNTLKRTQGLSVGELSEAIGMSYMGVKQHCIELEERGYLATQRRPRATNQVGRPELIYRLTPKTHDLFPVSSNEVTLELLRSAEILFGPAAPEKLLFTLFQRKAEAYLARAEQAKTETLADRAKWFAKVRDSEGFMAEAEADESGLRIVEHHSPIGNLLDAYPVLVNRLEQELFARVLNSVVKREQASIAGLYSCVFRVG